MNNTNLEQIASSRKLQIRNSKNFRNGKFQNLNLTPAITEGYSYSRILYEFFFKKNPRRLPRVPIPSVKTNLLSLTPNEDILVWFGHSSYFIQLDGKRILVDPVFSGNASPIANSNKSFPGSDIYTVQDLPNIDYLIITHDHYDHADAITLKQLPQKTTKVICGLGVGTYLEKWGFHSGQLIERDWNETIDLNDGFTFHTLPARHFSGRGLVRNNTLWMSVMMLTPSMKIYIGGDSGYDTHFADIGEQFGPIDLAILENGQFDVKWKYIHMLPDEVLKASTDLQAKKLFPVHSSKFAMANHAWDYPLEKLSQLNESVGLAMITPMIGEKVMLKDKNQQFMRWWED
jgi:L-ascorbate metabolism protein UlaG (beta-lactamase superfamily)